MKIHLAPYNPEWSNMYENEAARLRQILGSELADIQHIGSTSVAQLAAKPIIDIMVALHDFGRADAVVVPAMQAAGFVYIDKWNDVLPLRRFFVKEDKKGTRLAHLHIVGIDNREWWDRHIRFRDYLRTHPKTRKAYEALKHDLAQREWKDGSEYAGAKTEFIRKVEKLAKERQV